MGPAGGRRALSQLDLALALVAALRPRCSVHRPPPRLLVLGVFDHAGHAGRRGPLVRGSSSSRRRRDPLAGLGRSLLRLPRHPLPARPPRARSWSPSPITLPKRARRRPATGRHGTCSNWAASTPKTASPTVSFAAWPSTATACTSARRRVAGACCLPTTWDAYLARCPRAIASKLRRIERDLFDTGRAVLHTVERLDELPAAADLLIDLHQRRRRWLGQTGCFASPRFAAFHRQVMPGLLRRWPPPAPLAGTGRPARRRRISPGRKRHPVCLPVRRRAGIARRRAGPADHAWRSCGGRSNRAVGRWTFSAATSLTRRISAPSRGRCARFSAVANRPSARLRHNLWLAGANVKQWIKNRLCALAE